MPTFCSDTFLTCPGLPIFLPVRAYLLSYLSGLTYYLTCPILPIILPVPSYLLSYLSGLTYYLTCLGLPIILPVRAYLLSYLSGLTYYLTCPGLPIILPVLSCLTSLVLPVLSSSSDSWPYYALHTSKYSHCSIKSTPQCSVLLLVSSFPVPVL